MNIERRLLKEMNQPGAKVKLYLHQAIAVAAEVYLLPLDQEPHAPLFHLTVYSTQ